MTTMLHHNHPNDDQTPEPRRRITNSAARRMLGMIGRNYSDEEVTEILDALYGIAEAGFEACRDLESADNDGSISPEDPDPEHRANP